MNSDLQTQTSQEQAELGLNLGQHQQDYNGHHLHSQPGYSSQVSEVGSPIVSSTSNQEAESVMREVTNSGNIGSIITMLIDEQHVNIEDILTEEQFRQDCQQQGETKIKEEVEPGLNDFGGSDYQDFPFSVGGNYRPGENNLWSNGSLASIHSEQASHTSDVQSGLEKNLLTVPSVTQSRPLPCLAANTPANSVRDDKYWERRRKNNLAAKKSRDTRRMRENQLRLRVLFLENANKVLREEMDRKDVESGKLRERLSLYEGPENNCHSK